jgi:hypothetical protein
MRARLGLLAPAAGLCLGLSACGAKPADIFIIERTNASTHSTLKVLVNVEGGVHCNGGKELKLGDKEIVQARGIQEDLHEPASSNTVLPPKPGSVYTYSLRDEAGTLRFSDNSAAQTPAMHQLQLFVLQTAQQLCGISS